jgi:hypothetical protein
MPVCSIQNFTSSAIVKGDKVKKVATDGAGTFVVEVKNACRILVENPERKRDVSGTLAHMGG